MSVIAERSVRSEQAVRLLGVSRDPGRHALIVGVGVSVAEVRGSLFGYPPKKLHGFGKRAGCLPHRSERMLDGVRRGHGDRPTTPGNAPVPGVVTGTVREWRARATSAFAKAVVSYSRRHRISLPRVRRAGASLRPTLHGRGNRCTAKETHLKWEHEREVV
jgi:hypothetical protein